MINSRQLSYSHLTTTTIRRYAPRRRGFMTAMSRQMQNVDLKISRGHDEGSVSTAVAKLVGDGHWQLCNDNKGLERQFKFKTFRTTWDFMNTVATECKKTKHHPEWSNIYNTTHIRWTTHNPEGLSTLDTAMATFCDEAAKQYGEVQAEQSPDETIEAIGRRIESGGCCGKTDKKA